MRREQIVLDCDRSNSVNDGNSGKTGVRHNQIRINYRVQGSGPAIVLLHGFGGSPNDWFKIAENLRTQYTIIRPELSSMYLNQSLNFTEQLGLLECFFSELEKKYGRLNLGATSYGGALSWAGTFSSVEKTILINPLPMNPMASITCGILQKVLFAARVPFFIDLLLLTPYGLNNLNKISKILRPTRNIKNSEAKHKRYVSLTRKKYYIKKLISRFSSLLNSESWLSIEQMTKPKKSLLLISKGDQLFKFSSVQKIAEKIKSEVIVLEDGGHMMISSKPEEISKIISNYLSSESLKQSA